MPKATEIGRPPIISPQLSAKIAARADSLVREVITTWRKPDGKMWGDQDVTAMRVMFGVAMHTCAGYGILDCLAVKKSMIPPLPRDIPRTTSVDPAYLSDEATTKPMRK
jgi:hypothetical protein